MNDVPMYRDETASVYVTAAPGGGPAIMVVGNASVTASHFDPWAAALLSVSGLPGVATVFHAAREPDGRSMIVVDASGVTLAERLVAQGALRVSEVHTVGVALADTLARVHGYGLWHGAVCPSTVVFGDTVRLAGFDACAPGLAKPPTPGRFVAPEGVPGPAADVYGLAASLYLALGGSLAGGGISDLYDVPPPLTATLRAALSPDPAQRPTAQQFHQALTGVGATENTLPATPFTPDMVGSPVRPVNEKVASINLAIAGAAVAGIAGAAGVLVGKQAGGLLASAAGSGKASAGVSAAVKTGIGLTAAKIGAVAVGVAVVAAGVVVAVNVMSEEPADDKPLDTAIQQFDFKNATYTDPDQGIDVTLKDGTTGEYDFENASSGYTLLDDFPIVYADEDEDNDLDAMVVLARDGGNGFFRWAYVWTWQDGKATQLPYAIADSGRCGNDFEAPSAVDGHLRITRKIVVEMPDCADPIRQDETVDIGVRDGYPVTVAPAYGAAASCTPMDFETTREITGYEPTIVPVKDAPIVDKASAFTKMEAVYSTYESETPPKFVRARLTRTDGTVSCGWIPNNGFN